MSQERNPLRLVTAAAVVVAVVAIVVVALFRHLGRDSAEAPAATAAPSATQGPAATPTPNLQERLSERLKGVTLKTSDAAVRELVAEVSSHPELARWLANDDLVRRFVAAVANVAAGKSPRAHLGFLAPERGFRAVERNGRTVVDPSSYHRYDMVADVVDALDVEGTVALYRELEPLLDEAYREIAPPGASFRVTLEQAMAELLLVPVVVGDVMLEKKVVTYAYADERLEDLSEAQRHLLRMGPDNVQKIQRKLVELQEALAGPDVPTPGVSPPPEE